MNKTSDGKLIIVGVVSTNPQDVFIYFSFFFRGCLDAVDGLLAAVTDLLTHVLTIGKAVTSFGLQPNIRPLVIHILSGFNKIDLLGGDQSSSANLPARFHELLNMFPDNKVSEVKIEKNKSTCRSIDSVIEWLYNHKRVKNDWVDCMMSVSIIYDGHVCLGRGQFEKIILIAKGECRNHRKEEY